MKEIEPIEKKEEQNLTNSENDETLLNNNEEDLDEDSNLIVGSFIEAPKFMQDNEYILGGYLLNCNSFKKTFKSLFICHNETINIWSHLLSAIVFFFLIFYTSIFISNYKSQLNKLKNDISFVSKKVDSMYNESSTIMNNTYYSIKDLQNTINNINKNNDYLYQYSLKMILYLYNEINEVKIISNKFINILSPYFMETLTVVQDGIVLIKEEILNLIKLDTSKSEYLESELDEKFNTDLKKRKIVELARWPLFVIIHSAILLFIFSAAFHSIGTINERHHDILNRFDYGGISLLISGSCYPPYYYFFYYSNIFKYIYLSEITIFGIGIFLYSLTDDFNKPQKRTLRGVIFLIFGLCTGIPVIHMAFAGNKLEGNESEVNLIYWYIGGICYVIGALLYIIRFPEKKFPGKFDYIGASHQIFHILVFFGALFHFFGSLDAYHFRFNNMKLIQ